MGKKVKGCDYAAADEKEEAKAKKKIDKVQKKEMGIAEGMKAAKKDQGPTKKPGVKGQKKKGKIDLKKGQVY